MLVRTARRGLPLCGSQSRSALMQHKAEVGYKKYHEWREYMLDNDCQWSEEMKEAWLKGHFIGMARQDSLLELEARKREEQNPPAEKLTHRQHVTRLYRSFLREFSNLWPVHLDGRDGIRAQYQRLNSAFKKRRQINESYRIRCFGWQSGTLVYVDSSP